MGAFASVSRRARRALRSCSSGSVGGRDDDLPSGGGEDLWGLGGMSVVLSCARQAFKGGRFGDNDKTARRVCAVVRVQ
ncbi:hypothetical protein GGQ11_001897 [Salinibacter ruber]|uniref:Uncharacterized protein n=1 Tax=Salinibacter ruber TaxID=146919 RepID=A0A9X2UB88_9BACT|nr:hypothetical protein [Salinibacter ruber]MCS3952977.1 hypothetical protein [Salinibacter ruber]MCS4119521.1 hypothetical protein [Salinibacter ruber]MCS4155880.1 hypothetical protein [Salinibacter ruber]MCS4172032.1 hypothetical protein [Salinibacter ruber]